MSSAVYRSARFGMMAQLSPKRAPDGPAGAMVLMLIFSINASGRPDVCERQCRTVMVDHADGSCGSIFDTGSSREMRPSSTSNMIAEAVNTLVMEASV